MAAATTATALLVTRTARCTATVTAASMFGNGTGFALAALPMGTATPTTTASATRTTAGWGHGSILRYGAAAAAAVTATSTTSLTMTHSWWSWRHWLWCGSGGYQLHIVVIGEQDGRCCCCRCHLAGKCIGTIIVKQIVLFQISVFILIILCISRSERRWSWCRPHAHIIVLFVVVVIIVILIIIRSKVSDGYGAHRIIRVTIDVSCLRSRICIRSSCGYRIRSSSCANTFTLSPIDNILFSMLCYKQILHGFSRLCVTLQIQNIAFPRYFLPLKQIRTKYSLQMTSTRSLKICSQPFQFHNFPPILRSRNISKTCIDYCVWRRA